MFCSDLHVKNQKFRQDRYSIQLWLPKYCHQELKQHVQSCHAYPDLAAGKNALFEYQTSRESYCCSAEAVSILEHCAMFCSVAKMQLACLVLLGLVSPFVTGSTLVGSMDTVDKGLLDNACIKAAIGVQTTCTGMIDDLRAIGPHLAGKLLVNLCYEQNVQKRWTFVITLLSCLHICFGMKDILYF